MVLSSGKFLTIYLSLSRLLFSKNLSFLSFDLTDSSVIWFGDETTIDKADFTLILGDPKRTWSIFELDFLSPLGETLNDLNYIIKGDIGGPGYVEPIPECTNLLSSCIIESLTRSLLAELLLLQLDKGGEL